MGNRPTQANDEEDAAEGAKDLSEDTADFQCVSGLRDTLLKAGMITVPIFIQESGGDVLQTDFEPLTLTAYRHQTGSQMLKIAKSIVKGCAEIPKGPFTMRWSSISADGMVAHSFSTIKLPDILKQLREDDLLYVSAELSEPLAEQ